MRARVVTVVIIGLVLFSTIGILSLNADSKTRIENHFYGFREVKSYSNNALKCFVSYSGEKYQVRDAKTFRLLSSGFLKKESEQVAGLFDDFVIIWNKTEPVDYQEKQKFTFTDFDGNRTNHEFYSKLSYISPGENPIIISSRSGKDFKIHIEATQNGKTTWEKDDATYISEFKNNECPMWTQTTNQNVKILDPETGDTLYSLNNAELTEEMNKKITVLRTNRETHSDKEVEFVFIDNTKKQEFYRMNVQYDDRFIFHFDDENVFLFKLPEWQETPPKKFELQVTCINLHEGEVLNRKLEIDDVSSTNKWSLSKSDILGYTLAYWNGESSKLQLIDLRTNNILWKSKKLGTTHELKFFDHYLYLDGKTNISCFDINKKKYVYCIKNASTGGYEIVEHKGLEYFIYRFPTDKSELFDVEIKVADKRTGNLEPFEYKIKDVLSSTYTLFDIIHPTKHGVLHIPRFIRSKRISLYKPGVDEPYYETDPIFFERAFDVNSVSYVRDGEFLELRCSKNYNNLISDEDTVNIYLEIETGKIFDKERYEREIIGETK